MFLWTLDARPEEVNGDPELLGSNGSLFRNEREPLTTGLCLLDTQHSLGNPRGQQVSLVNSVLTPQHSASQSLDQCCSWLPERTGGACTREKVLRLSLRCCLGNGRRSRKRSYFLRLGEGECWSGGNDLWLMFFFQAQGEDAALVYGIG